MRAHFAWGFILSTVLIGVGSAKAAPPADISRQTRLFLDAYASGDRGGIVPMLDRTVVIYGSDADEFFRGIDAAMTLLADDQRLWGGTAKIGEMEHISVVKQGAFASIFFDASFSAGGRAPVPVRFAMVWRLVKGKWLLAQSSNVVPTHGQSAAQLLKEH